MLAARSPYFLLLASNLVSSAGKAAFTLTVGKILYDQTQTVWAFGFVFLLDAVLTLAMHIIAGPWADRENAQKTLVTTDLTRGTLLVGCAVLYATMAHPIWIFAMTFVIQLGKPFFRSAAFVAQAKCISENRLADFYGHHSSTFQAGQFVGITFAGLSLTYAPIAVSLSLTGICFLLSGAVLVGLPSLSTGGAKAIKRERKSIDWQRTVADFFADWRALIDYLKRQPNLVWILALGAGDYIFPNFANLLFAPLVAERLQGEGYWMSLLDGTFSLGALVVALFAGRIERAVGWTSAALLGLVGQTLGFLLLLVTTSGLGMLAVMLGIGAFNSLSWTMFVTRLQQDSSQGMKGKIALMRHMTIAVFTLIFIPLISFAESQSLASSIMTATAVCMCFLLVLGGYSLWHGKATYRKDVAHASQ